MSQPCYADSSVLVKRHLNEAGSGWVVSLTDPSRINSIFTANLSIIEVVSAFNRRFRESSITKADYDRARDAFLLAGNEYEFIKLDSAITIAHDLLERYPLRAGDAVQLASAVVVRTSLRHAGLQEPLFLASDNKLLDAAIAEGFTTDNPLLHP